MVGVGSFLTDISGGDLVILDGHQGVVILQPDDETVAQYRRQKEQQRTTAVQLETLRDLPAQTADGVRIELLGNIEFPYEVDHCVERGADGIGLYRTEFLYLSSDIEPTEETHFEAYSRVIKAMGDKPIVIRTLDLGADKLAQMPSPCGRAQSRAGTAQHPDVAAKFAVVSHTVAGYFAGQRAGQRTDFVSVDYDDG